MANTDNAQDQNGGAIASRTLLPGGKLSKAKGGKLARSETVTVRLDPPLRYLAEIAARKQRRTLSSFIEWAIEDSLKRVYLCEDQEHSSSVMDESMLLWDVYEPDRFAQLGIRHPELLNHGEQLLWKLIRENGYLWKGHYDGSTGRWTWRIREESLIFERLRDHWGTFNRVANGKAPNSELPTWNEFKEPEKEPEILF